MHAWPHQARAVNTPQTLRSFPDRSDHYDSDCTHNGHDSCNTVPIRHDWRKVNSLNTPMDDTETVCGPEMSSDRAGIAVET